MNAYPISDKIKDRNDVSAIQPMVGCVYFEDYSKIPYRSIRRERNYDDMPIMAQMAENSRKK